MVLYNYAIHKHSQKCLAQNVPYFGLLGLIPMIQPPFNSSCVALQYETEQSLPIEQFQSYMLLNIGAKITFECMNLVYKVLKYIMTF